MIGRAWKCSRPVLLLARCISLGNSKRCAYVEVLDNDGSTTVVLDDLVRGVESTTTVNVGSTRGLLEGKSVLADILPPDIVEGARAHAVDTLTVVWSNDDVGESTAS